jgi:hypothetical protein
MIDDLDMSRKGAQPGAKLLYAHVLLDRSGSMGPIARQTVDAFNEYVNGLAVTDGLDARISLTIFDTEGIDLIRDKVPAKAPQAKLSITEFLPRAGTPLNDAIGRTVSEVIADRAALRPGEGVAFVILTDGLENSSREYKLEMIKALLEKVQKEFGWLVLYLGANQDAFTEGVAHRGTSAANTMGYDTANMSASLSAASRASASYGLTGSNVAEGTGFTDEERKRAAGK